MNCRRVERLLSDGLDRPLPESASRAVADHLEGCTACRRHHETLRRLAPDLRSSLPRPEPAPGLARRALAVWEAEQSAPQRGVRPAAKIRSTRAWLAVPAATAVAAIAATFAGHVAFSPPQTPAAAPRNVALGNITSGSGKESAPAITRLSPKLRFAENAAGARMFPATAAAPPALLPRLRTSRYAHHALHQQNSHASVATALLLPAPPPSQASVAAATPRPVPVQDDLTYLNGGNEGAAALIRWARMPPDAFAALEARLRRAVHVKDDFVAVPFPRVASRDDGVVAGAIAAYQKEAAIVDPRLARAVTLALKGASLEDLCDQLKTQTGVPLSAARGVRDEKVTVFVDDRPARDVMRMVTHLFGFQWTRSGEEGDYSYRLSQDLRSQLAEEELRNQDLNAALLDVDDQMKALEGVSLEALKQRAEQATGKDQNRANTWTNMGGWGAIQLYQTLSPAERAALKSGQELRYGFGNAQPLPDAARQAAFASWTGRIARNPDGGARFLLPGDGGLSAADAGALPGVTLKIDRSELGEMTLQSSVWMTLPNADGSPGGGIGISNMLATGRSPATAQPDNAKANQEIREQPAFQRKVSFKPEPSCPRFKNKEATKDIEDGKEEPQSYVDETGAVVLGAMPPHTTSADIWEAVHRATGLPIVADSYMRLYPVPPMTVERVSLFDALCKVGDALGARWRKDGDFLLARSTRFFWDKLKEVPNRQLETWRRHRASRGGLPLDDVLAMASLPDPPLDAMAVGQVVFHCQELPEWALVGNWPLPFQAPPQEIRAWARWLGGLPLALRARVLSPDGLRFAELSPAEQQKFAQALLGSHRGSLETLPSLRIRMDYVPAGQYVWHPVVDSDKYGHLVTDPPVVGKTADAALAGARRVYPKAVEKDIKPTVSGVLALTFIYPNGDGWSIGKPSPIVVRSQPGPVAPTSTDGAH